MSLVDFRLTYWGHRYHPEVKKTTSATIIDYVESGNRIKSIQLFPDDTVVMAIGDGNQAQIFSAYPAKLHLYKYLWDRVDLKDKSLLRKHFKRCTDIREQIKTKLVPEAVLMWYMAVVLGAPDEHENNK